MVDYLVCRFLGLTTNKIVKEKKITGREGEREGGGRERDDPGMPSYFLILYFISDKSKVGHWWS